MYLPGVDFQCRLKYLILGLVNVLELLRSHDFEPVFGCHHVWYSHHRWVARLTQMFRHLARNRLRITEKFGYKFFVQRICEIPQTVLLREVDVNLSRMIHFGWKHLYPNFAFCIWTFIDGLYNYFDNKTPGRD